MNRRSFLKTAARAAAGGLAFPCLVGSSVLGRAGTVAPSNRIVIGCIGVGGQGTYNLKAFLGAVEQVWYVANAPKLSKSSVQVVAVCDVDTKHRNKAGDIVNKRYNNRDCVVYNDFRELLARDDIDAVTVCTPDHWHGVISIAAAKAGKDIYCEKPLTNTIAEGRAVCEAVKRYGRILQTGSHERSNDSVRFAAELVRNGYIGKLQTIRVNMPVEHGIVPPQPVMPVPKGFDYDMWLGHTPWVAYTQKRCHGSFRYILDYSGGEMTDRGAHILDLAQLSNDSDSSGPVELSGRGKRSENSLFDTFYKFQFECQYANGVRLLGVSKAPRGIKFEGADGWIFVHIHGGRLEAEPKSLLREQIGPNEITLGRTASHHENFLNSVRSRTQPFAPAEVGQRTGTICHLVNIAMLTGKKLTWDPRREQITNDDEANRMLARPMRSSWHI